MRIKLQNYKYNQALKEKGIDVDKLKEMFYSVFSKKKPKQVKHPEVIEKRRRNDRADNIITTLIENSDSSKIFDRAIAKLSTSNYEILGTEQIMQSILEDSETELAKILAEFGVTADTFSSYT